MSLVNNQASTFDTLIDEFESAFKVCLSFFLYLNKIQFINYVIIIKSFICVYNVDIIENKTNHENEPIKKTPDQTKTDQIKQSKKI
jgi:hypothetical protein